MIVHLGVILIAVAFASSSSFAHEQELQLVEGQTGTVGGHEITFRGVTTKTLPEKVFTQAQLQIDDGQTYAPGISLFTFSGQTIGTPSVRTQLTEDVMLTVLAFPEQPGDPLSVRVVVQPLVVWLWIGGGVMAVGTLLAAFPGRRRNPIMPVSAPVPAAGAPDPGAAGPGAPDPGADPELVPA
jgi:cytochrome c-type biogenesis protein CcmF